MGLANRLNFPLKDLSGVGNIRSVQTHRLGVMLVEIIRQPIFGRKNTFAVRMDCARLFHRLQVTVRIDEQREVVHFGIGLCHLCHLAPESLHLVDQLQETDADQFRMYVVEKLLTYQSTHVAVPRSRWDR